MDAVYTPGTLTKLFFETVDKYAHKAAALRYKAGGRWHDITHREYERRVRHFALALRRLGIQPYDRVAILSENRPEWAIADFACLCIHATDVPLYPTLPAGQIRYILQDSGAVAICCSSQAQVDKVLEIRDQLPALKHIIAFDAGVTGAGVIALADHMATGAAADTPGEDARFRTEALAVKPDDLATIIYTSGTTGDPKGVMLTHDNIYSNCVTAIPWLPITDNDSTLSFLPLSHIFERMAGHYAVFSTGATTSYAESVELLVQNLSEVRPTIVISVPRIYEKVYARALENAMASPVKTKIFFWAKANGEALADTLLAGRTPSLGLRLKCAIADKLVFSKLRARVGGNVRFFASGGAPLAADIARFFFAAKMPVYEGYGLTETSPIITVNHPKNVHLGTVGPVIPGTEVKIAEDGEILARGPGIMKGYYNKPEATAEAIDKDGWFHTGDIGVLEGGVLRITDRKKDLIVTAGGKNIAPQPIEAMAKRSRFVASAVMLGDRRKFPIMLIVPQFDPLTAWAKEQGLAFTDHASLIALPQVESMMEKEVLSQFTSLARFESPRKVLLLEQDFSIEAGDLTPTLKVKRRVVEQRLLARIDALYAASPGEGI